MSQVSIAELVGRMIDEAMTEQEISNSKLARLLGVSRQTVSDWRRGNHLPRPKKAPEVARILGLPLSAVSADPEHVNVALLPNRPQTVLVPVISWVNAGVGAAAMDQSGAKAFIQLDIEASDGTFALEIRGDSMSPEFNEGDVIVIDPTVTPVPDDCVVCELYTPQIDEEPGNITFKQYSPRGSRPDAPSFDLVPVNDDYDTITVNRNNPGRIIGVMIEHRRRRRVR